jgi:hypothetical protein
MMELLADTLRDTSLIEWWVMMVLPMLGGFSFTQWWKVRRRKRTKEKPRNHETVFVATLACTVLSTVVQGLTEARSWPEALGVGLAIGPAAPLLFAIVTRLAPERIARAMRGGRGPWRAGGAWTEAERKRLLHDTLYGDDDTDLLAKLRAAREQHERERRAQRESSDGRH